MTASLHLLSVIADDQIELKLKTKTTATANHDNVIKYLARDLPTEDEKTLTEYRKSADDIIRTYSKLIGEAFY